MQDQVFQISEETKGIVKTNFDEKPYLVDAGVVRAGVYYLPKQNVLGGDTFLIRSDAGLTIALLSDFPKDGEDARRDISNARPHLEEIVDSFVEKPNSEDFSRRLFELDQHLYTNGFGSACLSLLRITEDERVLYLNVGENLVLGTKSIDTELDPCFSDTVGSQGVRKFGFVLLNERINHNMEDPSALWDIFKTKVKVFSRVTNPGDKFLIASDGIYDPGEDFEMDPEQVEEFFVKHKDLPVENFIEAFNSFYISYFWIQSQSRPKDDYTIIVTGTL